MCASEADLGTFSHLPRLMRHSGAWLPNGVPCPCPKSERNREQLRKWGMQL
jgi:hypothetical protein